jgi:DNA-directed RNA polymerase specialized sigma24 family protein
MLNKTDAPGVFYVDVRDSSSDQTPSFDAQALDHLGTLKALSRRLVQNQSTADNLVQDTYRTH